MLSANGCVLGTHKELVFWLRIMKEHSLFMRNGLKAERPDLAREAEMFRREFAVLEKDANQSHTARTLIDASRELTRKLLRFKLRILNLLITCKTGREGGSLYPLLVDHIAREARQFLMVLDWCEKVHLHPETTAELLVSKEVFWLRQMADHAKFIRGLLDPSERSLVNQAQMWSDTFDRLFLQAKDIESMLRARTVGFPTVARFTSEVVKETKGLRDFKRAAEKLLAECQALSIISPLLADHVAREAEYFINVIQALEMSMKK